MFFFVLSELWSFSAGKLQWLPWSTSAGRWVTKACRYLFNGATKFVCALIVLVLCCFIRLEASRFPDALLRSGVQRLRTSSELNKRWSTATTCATKRCFWPKVNCKMSSELLGLSKVNLPGIVDVQTVHCPIDSHALWLNILPKLYGGRQGGITLSISDLLNGFCSTSLIFEDLVINF